VSADPNDNPPPAAKPASRLSRSIARLVLRLPRYVPAALVGVGWRRAMLREGARPFTVDLDDGAHIDALHFPTATKRGRRLPVILNHGYLEAKEFHRREVRLLREAGHDVLLYDLRGHGRSGGRFTTLGVHEQGDLTRLIDACQQRGYIADHVITMGYSAGAAVVIQQAPDDSRVAGVVALTPFVDMIGAIRSFHRVTARWFNAENLLRGFEEVAAQEGFDLTRSNTLEAIRRLSVPLLLAVGDRDIHLPPEQHADLLRAAVNASKVEYHLVPGRNHISIYWRLTRELGEAIVNFCARVSEKAGGLGSGGRKPKGKGVFPGRSSGMHMP